MCSLFVDFAARWQCSGSGNGGRPAVDTEQEQGGESQDAEEESFISLQTERENLRG